MTVTGLDVFDRTVHKTNSWLNELMEILGWHDKHKAYLALRVTLHALREQQPARIVVAVPTASPETCERLKKEVDDVICAVTPEPFYAVGLWYEDFSQTTDEEVRELLARAATETEGERSHATHGRPHTD
jgi:uncharacterized protein (DUF2267 family)